MRDEKLHAVVVRSRFPSQHAQNTPTPNHFWKLTCRKSARYWSTFPSQNLQHAPTPNHFWKFTCRKNCTPFVARSTLFKPKVKNLRVSEYFLALRRRYVWQVQSTSSRVRHREGFVAATTSNTLHYTLCTIQYTTLPSAPLPDARLHCTTLHSVAPANTTTASTTTATTATTQHKTTLHYATIHCINYKYNCNCHCNYNYN